MIFGLSSRRSIFLFYRSSFVFHKKMRSQLSDRDLKLLVQNLKYLVIDLSSSRKNTRFQRNNRLISCPKSEDIADLKSIIFQKIFRMAENIAELISFDRISRFVFGLHSWMYNAHVISRNMYTSNSEPYWLCYGHLKFLSQNPWFTLK